MKHISQTPISHRRTLPVSWSRTLLAASLGLLAASLPCLAGPVSMTGTGSYSQNFDTLVATGSGTWADDSTISGWYSQRTGTGATIASGTGSSTSGGLYSFGTGTATERALGSLGSGTAGHFAHGVMLKNDDAVALTITNVSYRGEQWRNSAASAQTMTFWYQISPTAITSLTPNVNTVWTAASSLDFTSPVIAGTAGAIDGNVAPNFTVISPGASIAVPAGQYVMLRWSDVDHSGADHGLSIDDVTIGWGAAALPSLSLSLASPSILEGGVSAATITRTGDLTSALTVDVTTSDATAATVPATATFLANSATASFNVTAFNDTIQDGLQSANITVSFTGYTSDVKPITVDDDGTDVSLLTINEVCPDAAADNNGDGTISNTADEFIELVNTSGASLDISGWTISDNSGVTFTFPASTVLVTGQAVVIFGGGTVPPTIGSAVAFKAPSGLNLNNTGGDLVAVRNGATLIAKMAYGVTVTGQVPSFNLNGDIKPGPFVLHTAVTGAVGDVSPGKKVDQTQFITISPLTLVLLPTSISENGGTSTGTVSRPGPTTGALLVSLTSAIQTEATVPVSVEIQDGQSSADFTITGVDDTEPDGPINVTITASAIGFSAAQAVLEVTSDTDPVPPATLAPGSIAFTGFNADGLDHFAFVALVPIPQNTQIRFTDNEWNGQPIGAGGLFNTSEGFVQWTAPTGGVPAGTVVIIGSVSDSGLITATTDGSTAVGTVSGTLNLNASDETLYAYQGTALRASGFLSVIATHTADSVVETGLSGSQLCYLPADVDIAAYIGSRSSETVFSGYLALIADTSNLAKWVNQNTAVDESFDNIAPDVPFDGTVFTLAAAGSYDSWKSVVNNQTADQDFDGDGLDNGTEYFMGTAGNAFTPNPGIVSGAVTWPRASGTTITSWLVEVSTNLGTWENATVNYNSNLNTSNPAQVVFTMPTTPGKFFVRLRVEP